MRKQTPPVGFSPLFTLIYVRKILDVQQASTHNRAAITVATNPKGQEKPAILKRGDGGKSNLEEPSKKPSAIFDGSAYWW